MRRYLFPLVIGISGAAILISLGLWQMRRLEWKLDYLSQIEARIGGAPVALPDTVSEADLYLPVTLTGQFAGPTVQVLVSQKQVGAGHLQITALDLGDRKVLVDRGFRPLVAADARVPQGTVTVTGNVYWPDRIDSFTPEPEPANNLWFVRDVPALAEHLGTEPILVVARELSQPDPGVTPLPIDTSGVPNDHLEYAITWFGLATVWLGMTALLLWRIRLKKV